MKRLAQITDLSVELLIYIAVFLDLESILRFLKVLVPNVGLLRRKVSNTPLQTCRYCLDLSRHRRIWTEAFETVRQSQSFFYLRKEFEDMTPLEMQRTLVSAYKVEQAFLRPRKRLVPLIRNTPGSASPIHCMSFLLDRFILTTHYNSTFNLWARRGMHRSPSMPKCNPKEAGVLLSTVCLQTSLLFISLPGTGSASLFLSLPSFTLGSIL